MKGEIIIQEMKEGKKGIVRGRKKRGSDFWRRKKGEGGGKQTQMYNFNKVSLTSV